MSLTAGDVERSVGFYTEALGFEVTTRFSPTRVYLQQRRHRHRHAYALEGDL